jgi:hypothetical protein
MGTRVQLQTLLETFVDNVFFQPPESLKLTYPCIIYSRSTDVKRFASNNPYNRVLGYTVIVLDANPDSEIPAMVADLPMSDFNRSYRKNNINHDVFTVYF